MIPTDPPIRYKSDQLALDAGYRWMPELELIPYIRFAETYCLLDSDWDYQPMKMLDYQINDLAGPMLGWVCPNSNTLRTTLSIVYSPKKIGKSFYASSLLAYWAATKQGQNCALMASKVEQADIIFSMLVGFTKHPALSKRWHIQHGKKIITDLVTGSTIKVMVCRGSGVSGKKLHLLIIDEIAEAPRSEIAKVWDRVKFAGAANVNGSLTMTISTPAHELDTVGYDLYQRAKAITTNENTHELRTHACVYGADPDDDWTKESTWKKAGPHIGQLVPMSFYQEEFRKAHGNPSDELAMKIYLLGMYVRNHKQFINMENYSKCITPFLPKTPKQRVCIGFDNGGSNDLMALTILIPQDEKVFAIGKAFISEEALRKKNKVGEMMYQQWADKGLLEIVNGETIQLPQLQRILEKIYNEHDVAAMSYDPWQMKGLVEDYAKKKRLIIECPQYGKYMNPLILELERRIAEQTIVFQNDPVMRFCFENLQVKEDKWGRLEACKESSRHKIDLAISTIIALNALPEAIKKKVVWTMPPVMSM